jgi:MFS family permease
MGDVDRAAVVLGPATSAAWLASAGGAAAIPWATRRFGSAVTAAALRVLQGATVAGMALAAGPAGLIVAFLGTYAIHGAANPVHMALLHRQVDRAHRTTVLSVNSMVSMPAAALGGIVLGWLADVAGVSGAMVAGAVVLAVAAPLYLPARDHDRVGRPEQRSAGAHAEA